MLVDRFDGCELDRDISLDHVNRTIGFVEPDRSLAFACAFQRFVVVAGNLPHLLETKRFDGGDPEAKLLGVCTGTLARSLAAPVVMTTRLITIGECTPLRGTCLGQYVCLLSQRSERRRATRLV